MPIQIHCYVKPYDNQHLNTQKAAPKLSEDTDDVLYELGYLKTDIEKLRNGRVIL